MSLCLCVTLSVCHPVSVCLSVTLSVCHPVQQPPTAGSIEAPVKAVSDWQNYVDDTGNVIEGEDDIL